MQCYKIIFGVLLPLTTKILHVDGLFLPKLFRKPSVAIPPKAPNYGTRKAPSTNSIGNRDLSNPYQSRRGAPAIQTREWGFNRGSSPTWVDPKNNFNNPMWNKNRKAKHDYLTKTERDIIKAQKQAEKATNIDKQALYWPHRNKLARANQKFADFNSRVNAKIDKSLNKIENWKQASGDYSRGIADKQKKLQYLENLKPDKMKPVMDDYYNHLNFEKHKGMQKIYDKQRNFPKMQKLQDKYAREQRAFHGTNPNPTIQQWPAVRARDAPGWVAPPALPLRPTYGADAYLKGPMLPKVSGKYTPGEMFLSGTYVLPVH